MMRGVMCGLLFLMVWGMCGEAWASSPTSPTSPTSPASPTTPTPTSTAPRRGVVVLQPGILGFAHLDGLGDYWGEVPERLRAQGYVVIERAPAPVGSPVDRGLAFADDVIAVANAYDVERVVVVAHSQGGVDVRAALASVPALRQRIGAVATVASPHHGSTMTDVADVFPDALVDGVLGGIHGVFLADQGLAHITPQSREALLALSKDGMTRFNAAHPDPGVPFYSVGGVTGADVDGACVGGAWGPPEVTDVVAPTALWNLWATRAVVGDHSSDGVVPTASMRFGYFLGCVPADHGDWMGWVSHPLEEELVWSPTPFLVKLVGALSDVSRFGDEAMAAHVPALARYARATVGDDDDDSARVALSRNRR